MLSALHRLRARSGRLNELEACIPLAIAARPKVHLHEEFAKRKREATHRRDKPSKAAPAAAGTLANDELSCTRPATALRALVAQTLTRHIERCAAAVGTTRCPLLQRAAVTQQERYHF